MTKKIVGGTKDENGIYLPQPKTAVPPTSSSPPALIEDLSIDDLLKRGLRALYGAMRAIEVDIGSGLPARETIQNLKDVMSMLKELKKDEKDLLSDLTDDELSKMVSNDNIKQSIS